MQVRYFFYVLVAGAVSSVLGGAFGWLIGQISPEFVRNLCDATHDADFNTAGYAVALGMVSGLLIGVGVMSFSLFLSAALQIAGASRTKRSE